MKNITLDAVDSFVLKIIGPRRSASQINRPNLARTSANELKTKSGADKAETSGHYEGTALNAFVLAQMHFSDTISPWQWSYYSAMWVNWVNWVQAEKKKLKPLAGAAWLSVASGAYEKPGTDKREMMWYSSRRLHQHFDLTKPEKTIEGNVSPKHRKGKPNFHSIKRETEKIRENFYYIFNFYFLFSLYSFFFSYFSNFS